MSTGDGRLPPCGAEAQEGSCAHLREHRCSAWALRLDDVKEAIRFESRCMDLFKRRDFVIPLEQRRSGSTALDRGRVQDPDRVKDRMIVGIEGVSFKL